MHFIPWMFLEWFFSCIEHINCASHPFEVMEMHKNEESQEAFSSGRNSTYCWILHLRGPNQRAWNQMRNFFIFKGFCGCLKEHFNTATFFFCIFRVDKVRLLQPFLNSPFAKVSWVYESSKNLGESKFQTHLLHRGFRNRCSNKENWMEKSSDVWNGCFSRELRVWRVIIWGTEKVKFGPRLSENQRGDSYLNLCSKTALCKNM